MKAVTSLVNTQGVKGQNEAGEAGGRDFLSVLTVSGGIQVHSEMSDAEEYFRGNFTRQICYLRPCMILITANKLKRLLYFRFMQRVTADEFRANAEDVRRLLADFPAGFRLLSDLERLESMDDDCAPEIGRMMDLFKERGIELVVRIVPEPEKDIGLSILSVFHYGRKLRTVTCKDITEAVPVLKL